MKSIWPLLRGKSKEEELHIAIANNRLDEARSLIKNGVKLNKALSTIINGSGEGTALHLAASEANLEAVELLVNAGADLNVLDDLKLTPLMCACSAGGDEGGKVALFLLERGAKATIVSPRRDKATALQFATKSCSSTVIEKLIEHGALVEGPSGIKQSPLMLAARENNTDAIKVLVRHGADIYRECELEWALGKTAEWMAENDGSKDAQELLQTIRKNV